MKANRMQDASDNQLAQFIDGNTTDAETDEILDAIQSKENLKTLALAFSAKAMMYS
jgi:hypothetical protein